MKKIFGVMFAVSMMFIATSCGTKTAPTVEAPVEDTCCVEEVDSLAVDSVEVEAVAADSVVAE